ncbi:MULTISPECIES: FAD-binding domain-containing protein [Halomonadaceae]|uniref:Deoxyribodipyrimidine photo-lyase n=2 Tax=Vreelandella TaxID=3137766 RepID=A0A7Z0S1H5_9GAMM|nr:MULTISPECIES: FAD-binding domain-containing protein [Halomonas]NYS80403.1 deoxyribodipyrimidine photo-lyase [Halomonas glaciei]|tara:strand:+ start:1491 stop:3023 length:1533 start_codon:yes stop_codon:yes gene_type:complete
MAKAPIQVVWFKRDLRIHDHTPLSNAAAAGPVLPVFAIEPEQWQAPDSALRHWQFAADSLADLSQALGTLGLPLCLWQGSMLDLLAALKAHYGEIALHSHEETGNAWSFARDLDVKSWCQQHETPWHEARQHGVVRGLKSRVADLNAWEKQWETLMTAPTATAPQNAQAAQGWQAFHHIDVKHLHGLTLGFDTTPCPERQQGGRSEGRAVWRSFVNQRGRRYRGSLSKPLLAWEFGSRLSPHLAWGTLSMREVVQSLRRQRKKHAEDTAWTRSMRAFASRLHWHCHFIQKLESEPSIEHQTLHPALRGLRERGQTGVPLVDACMRSLIATGWINFRMRAMLISHATFGLGLHWYEPALHLARLFTDFEPGIHYPQVQMQAGATGTNALWVYNPIKQAEDNDPSGEFVARWVPELTTLPLEWRAKPWALPEILRQRFGFQPGVNYPIPNDFECEARHWKKMLYELRRTPDAREASQAIVDKLARQRKPPAQRAKKAKPAHRQQLSLFVEGQ